jgi:hypothetical protein
MPNLSICIPRVDNSTSKKYVYLSFQNVGEILKVDIVDSNNGSKKVFVHFAYCYNNKQGSTFKKIIENGGTVKFVHCKLGWFWKCSKSRSARSITRGGCVE